MDPLAIVLGKLDGHKEITPGGYMARYLAKCPAHADSSPSLCITQRMDGALLLHCFAGCEVTEIVGAMGLEITELFPPKPQYTQVTVQEKKIPYSEAMHRFRQMREEIYLIVMYLQQMSDGKALSEEDRARCKKCANRIFWILDATKQ